MGADLYLVLHRDLLFLKGGIVRVGKAELNLLVRDSLAGEEVLDEAADDEGDDHDDHDDDPFSVGGLSGGLIGEAVVRPGGEKAEGADEEGTDHAGDAGSDKLGGVGGRGKKGTLRAVSGRKADESGVGCVIERIGKGVIEIVADGDEDDRQPIGVFSCRPRRERNEEEKEKGDGDKRHADEDQRPCLTGDGRLFLDQPADGEVSDDDDDGGNDGQEGREEVHPFPKTEDAHPVLGEVGVDDAVCHQGEGGAEKVAQGRLRKQLDVRGLDLGR